MNVLVTGADGQLGKSLRRRAANVLPQTTFHYTDIGELDITDPAAVERVLDDTGSGLVINCAAYTAVDRAEEEPVAAALLNAEAPAILGRAMKSRGGRVIHVSTDYVFNGKASIPYKEDARPNPAGVYGTTKRQGEQALLKALPDAIILRTSWLYSEDGHNFVRTMLRLGQEQEEVSVVYDQVASPTWAGDLAETILRMVWDGLQTDGRSIFHYANEGVASWYDLAVAVMEIAELDCRVRPVRSAEYPRPAPRPAYSVLDKTLIKDTFGLTIPHWRKSLEECLRQLGY